MASELVEIARPPYLSMAEEMRLFLEDHDIAVVLDHANTGLMLPHLGTAIGVPVLVRAAEATKASQLLEGRRQTDTAAGPWYCGVCRVDVEPTFEACWNCGQPRQQVEQPFPAGREPAATVSDDSEALAQQKAEELIRRAWKAAMICFGLLPFIGHFYSIMLLLESTGQSVRISPESQKLFRRTLLVDVLAMVAFGAFLTALFWPTRRWR